MADGGGRRRRRVAGCQFRWGCKLRAAGRELQVGGQMMVFPDIGQLATLQRATFSSPRTKHKERRTRDDLYEQ